MYSTFCVCGRAPILAALDVALLKGVHTSGGDVDTTTRGSCPTPPTHMIRDVPQSDTTWWPR